MLGHGLARPYWTHFFRGLVAWGEDEIRLRRARSSELGAQRHEFGSEWVQAHVRTSADPASRRHKLL